MKSSAVAGPHAWTVFREAFKAAPGRLLHDNSVNYVVLAIFSIIDGAAMRNYSTQEAINDPFPLTGLLGIPALYFTLAAAMRLRHPGYAMRARTAIALVIAHLFVFVITLAGLLLFIVPGVWICVRISLSAYIVALDSGGAGSVIDAIRESFRITDRYFWQTATLFLWEVLLLGLPLTLLYGAAIAAFVANHKSAYYFAPVLMLASVYGIQVVNLATLEWTVQLRVPRDASLPAP